MVQGVRNMVVEVRMAEAIDLREIRSKTAVPAVDEGK